MAQTFLFQTLVRSLEAVLREDNPWWKGERLFGIPPIRRWAFQPVLTNVKSGPAPITVLRGPRQIGKTTLSNQVIDALLAEGIPAQCILRVQFDALPDLKKLSTPILDIVRWYSETILGTSFNKAAWEGRIVHLFFDEVQNLPDWSAQLKHLVDMQPVRVVVTGSSALRIEAGRDSLAGRITTMEMGPLLLREIAEFANVGEVDGFLPLNGLAPMKEKAFWQDLRRHGERNASVRRRAFQKFSERGAYPFAQIRQDLPWEQVADQLNENVIQRAIQHDLRMGPRGQRRDEQLLTEVFRMACRYVGQSPRQAAYVTELQQTMHANVGWPKILAYLKFLDGTLLLRLIEPLEIRLKKKKGASKLCLCDHALRAAWLQEIVPLTAEALENATHLSDLAGHIAESVTGYFLRSISHLDVAHFPERSAEPEVDFILTLGEQRIPVEVKYRRRINFQDTLGLRAFIEKSQYNAPFGILVTLFDEPASDDPRIVSLPLSSLLLLR